MRAAWMAGAAALGVVLVPAGQAAAEDQNPFLVIEQLELAGYTVNVDRIGSAPIEECTVTEVRNPQQVTESVAVLDRDDHHHRGDVDVIDVVVHQSISVT
ncbi:hypothetical protein C6A85_97810, partial [Mycobacterium sp. ITM-2017-0098]